jgi:hypothetical protein
MTDPGHPDLERALRQALRPLEPRAGFEERVMLALDASRRPRFRPLWPLASAAAAVLALIAAGALSYREHVQALRAAQTRVQVLEALRITSEKLDKAFRLVADETGSVGSAAQPDGRSDGHRQFN